MPQTLDIQEADPQGADALGLLHLAAEEARALYPELGAPGAPWPTNLPTPARGVYLVACLGGQPAGMAAHRPLDEEATELRRLYVPCALRRRGIASRLLEHIEEHARRAGFVRLVLETGNRQQPAMALYERRGFARIENFGSHLGDPTSVCYGKNLVSPAPRVA